MGLSTSLVAPVRSSLLPSLRCEGGLEGIRSLFELGEQALAVRFGGVKKVFFMPPSLRQIWSMASMARSCGPARLLAGLRVDHRPGVRGLFKQRVQLQRIGLVEQAFNGLGKLRAALLQGECGGGALPFFGASSWRASTCFTHTVFKAFTAFACLVRDGHGLPKVPVSDAGLVGHAKVVFQVVFERRAGGRWIKSNIV